jgi:hypothetical protein
MGHYTNFFVGCGPDAEWIGGGWRNSRGRCVPLFGGVIGRVKE